MHDAAGPACRFRVNGGDEWTGLRFRQASGLLDEALVLLDESPRTTVELARRVFGLQGDPGSVGDQLLAELFIAEPEVMRQDDGTWRLEPGVREPDIGFDDVPFTVVDVETTGAAGSPDGRVVEVAAVRIESRQIVDVFASLVDPGVRISPWVARLTGISDRMLKRAPPFEAICDELRARLEGRTFVAHNAGYDWAFVRDEMRRARSLLPQGPRLCTVHLTRRLLPGLRRRGLDALAHYYDVEIQERHRARGDALATAQVLLLLLAEAEKKNIVTWSDLMSFLGTVKRSRRTQGSLSC